jgi:uncharacterized protein DUF4439
VTALPALQRTLAAEHAAVYVYGALGAQTSSSATPELFAAVSAAYAEHRSRRDLLSRAVTELGATPVAAAPSYVLPERLGTPDAVTRAARRLEEGCAATYADLVANSVGERRRWAVEALTNAAVRGLVFRGTPEMFPGADEFADR